MARREKIQKRKDPNPDLDLSILAPGRSNKYFGLVDDEWHPKLRGRQGARIYREMSDNDALISGFIYSLKNLLRQVDYDIIPSGNTAAHIKEAEFIKGALFGDMSITWSDFLSDVLTFPIWGWSGFEIVYKKRLGRSSNPRHRSRYKDGRIGWRKFAIRQQEHLDRWEFDLDGGLDAVWFATPLGTKRIPIEKFLLFRTESNRQNPEGRSLLRGAYRAWWFKKRLEEILAVGAERDLVGLPDMQVPPKIMSPAAGPEEKQLRQSLETLVQQIRRDEREGLVRPAELDTEGKPTGYKFSLVSSGGSRQIDLNKAITRYDQHTLTSVLFQFLLLGQNEKGSFALADTQTDLAGYALGAFLDSIVDVFNRFAIPRLETLNRIPQDLWPRMIHGDIEKPKLQELSAYVATLGNAGFLSPDDKTEQALREYGGLPHIDLTIEEGSDEETNPTTSSKQNEVLTDTQIKALLQIVKQVQEGTISKESALAIIPIAFPSITRDQAESLFSPEV
jgi:hypothetical protein